MAKQDKRSQGKRLKVVLVGCGGMSGAWMTPALAMPEVEIVGLVDMHRPAAEKLAERFKLPPTVVYDTITQAVKATGATCVFDVTIPKAHVKVALETFKLGCHLIGEKPMSDNLADAKKMVRAAQAAGVTYAVMQNYRYSNIVHTARKHLDSGRLGQVEEIHTDFYMGPHFGGFREEMPFPLLIDMSIHTFDTARYLSGADPVSVYCHAFNPKHSWYQGDASAVAVFEMKLPNGDDVVFSYRGSWCSPGMDTGWGSKWRIIASKGVMAMNDNRVSLSFAEADHSKGAPAKVDEVIPGIENLTAEGHPGMLKEGVNAILTGKRPQTICTDNIKSLAMVLAAVKSAQTKKRVPISV